MSIPVLSEDVLRIIFSHLSIEDLSSCRSVSRYWRMTVDSLLENDFFWSLRCKEHFKDVYHQSRRHRSPGLSWQALYRSLTLWLNLSEAKEEVQGLPLITKIAKEITNFQLLRNGVIGILTRSSIDHYNILTRQHEADIKGEYKMYAENNNHVVILNYQRQLIISRKAVFTRDMVHYKTYECSVKTFLLIDPLVVMITTRSELYYIHLRDENLDELFVWNFRQPVICFGFKKDTVFVLTYHRQIYSLIKGVFELIHMITEGDNLLNILLEYNLIQDMDWLVYQQWLHIFHYEEPTTGYLRDITTVKKYGDIVLIGTKWTDVLIYHIPKSKAKVSLYLQTPVKVYNLSNDKKVPKYLNPCPIIQLNVMESEDKHIVVAATPYQISTIILHHITNVNEEMRKLLEDSQKILCLNQ